MKFKGKKVIMAAALASIVAVGSFSTVAFAEEKTEHNVRIYIGPTSRGNGRIATNKTKAREGDTVTITAEPESGVIIKWLSIAESIDSYNKEVLASFVTGKCEVPIQMPDHDVAVIVTFDYEPDPDPTPTPTPTPTPDPTPTLSWKKGDANCDGIVTAADATAVLKHLAGIIELSYIGSVNADMDQNGKVTAADATAILKFLINEQ
ncbi:MAG: hypothetical protein HDT42_03745 [Ruminococcaceae bacterium]|nr:hypothetical protein [Oscillospiraceae bacterium]